MKSTSEPAFTVVDKRGSARIETAEPEKAPEPKPEAPLSKGKWKSIGYMLTLVQVGRDQMISGRAVGLRSDGKSFVTDYILFPLWPENLTDWRPKSKRRLDTFLGCNCTMAHGVCAEHKTLLPQWQREDMDRVRRLAEAPVCEALEALHRAETVKQQSRIILPGSR